MRILYIEDDEIDAESVSRMLRGVAKVAHYYDLSEVSAGVFDAAVLDLGLRTTNSEETVSRFFEIFPELPLVVLTGDCDEGTREQCLEWGAHGVFCKDSYCRENFLSTLHVAVRRRRSEEASNEEVLHLKEIEREIQQLLEDLRGSNGRQVT